MGPRSEPQPRASSYKAVIFDIGGVVMRSPFIAIAEYERQHGLLAGYINNSIAGYGSSGAWQQFERGELDIRTFYQAFGRDLSNTDHGNRCYRTYCERKGICQSPTKSGGPPRLLQASLSHLHSACPQLPEKLDVNGRELFGAMMRASQSYDPYIREAILRIRGIYQAAAKHRVIALTNNFARVGIPPEEFDFLGSKDGVLVPTHLTGLFDDFCDSSVLGMRKPEPEFYLTACRRNNIKPTDAIFLDDLGLNLKAARELGMGTIHVRIGKTLEAVKELEARIGIKLHDPEAGVKL